MSDRWPDRQARRRRHDDVERGVSRLLASAALISVAPTFGIVTVLLTGAWNFFHQVSPLQFLGDTRWTPLFEPRHFGIWPLVAGTLLTTLGACVVALPTGLAVAVYLGEYADARIRRVCKPLLEILWGVPTVVYGYFALNLVTPSLRQLLPDLGVFNAAAAAVVMGIMIMPMVASPSEDALMAVPRALRDAAFALGATKREVVTKVVLPAAAPGIAAALVLAVARAVGETMIVTIAAGTTPRLTLNPFDSVQTMTAYIVQVSLGDTPHGTDAYYSLFAVALVLFVITLTLNIAARAILRRRRVGTL